MYESIDASILVGKTIRSIERDAERITFNCDNNESFAGYHMQDCCESVGIHDVIGNTDDLIGSPVIAASERADGEWPSDVEQPKYLDSFTWTYYEIETAKGKVVVRWLGESNGYYGETPQFSRTHEPVSK